MAIKSMAKRIAINIALLATSLAVMIGFGEMALRILYPPPADYRFFPWPPHQRQMFKVDPAIFPGLNEEALFVANSAGIRGDEFSNDQDYRILALGGSTTECLLLDGPKAWPYLLQNKLTANSGKNVWVGNVGKSGLNSRDHIMQLAPMLDQYDRIDAVLIMEGANDLLLRLAKGTDYNPDYLFTPDGQKAHFKRAFARALPPKPENAGGQKPWYEHSAIWKQINELYHRSNMKKPKPQAMVQDTAGSAYIKMRAQRKRMPRIDYLPDLVSSLAEFRRNMTMLAKIAKERNVKLFFVTQPAIWGAHITKEQRDLLWLGGNGNIRSKNVTAYYSAEALAQGLEKYNNVTRQVAELESVGLIDIAANLPKNTTVHYDGVHFNENGAQLVANLIYQKIIKEDSLSPAR